MQEILRLSKIKQCKKPVLWGSVVTTAAMLWLCCSSVALAKSERPIRASRFPTSPLEVVRPDPLLPQSWWLGRPLTAAERQDLEAALDELDTQATAVSKAGSVPGAFEIWNRELRLRRVLGSLEEVEALGRVGAIAWRNSLATEVQIITQRLQAIQQLNKSQPSVDLELLPALGEAYQQLRSPQQALLVYQQVLAIERGQQDIDAQVATLKTIAELHLSWFDYKQATASYKELLDLVKVSGDRASQMYYLQQLAYIYDRAKQPQQAVAVKQQLAELYLNQKDFTRLPALRLAMGTDYEFLGQIDEAFNNYKEAYATAWSLQQFYRASEALRKIVLLYRTKGKLDEALQTSRILLQANQQGDDDYGRMNTYDQIGQIYLKLGNYHQAKDAFENGLQLAKQLHYQETYFDQQIAQVNQRISK